MKIFAGVAALFWAVAQPACAGAAWQVIAGPPTPAAAFDAGTQGKIVVTCDNNRGLHTYVLAISGPADGLKNSDWTQVNVAGERVMMAVQVDAGTATLTASSSTTRYAENDGPGNRDVYDAVAAMRRASSIGVKSGDFHMAVPAAGLANALAGLTAACGDPQKLSKQVKARSEPM